MSEYRFDQIAINSTEKKKPEESDKYTYIGLEHLDSMDLEVHRWGSEVAPKGEKLLMKKGDVLFGKRRAYQKKVAIAPFDGIFSAHGMVLRPNEKIVDKDFFPLFISSDYFLDAAIKISVGSLSPTINWRDLRELKFSLPDLDTQKKLAKVLWSINATMQNYKVLLAKTDELVKSQFIELFGDPEINPRNLKMLPILEVVSRLKNGANIKQNKEKEGYPITRIETISDRIVDREKMGYAGIMSLDKYREYVLEDDDILMSHINSITHMGKSALYKRKPDENIIHGMNLLCLRPRKDKVIPMYLYSYFQTDYFYQQVLSITKPAVNQASMTTKDLGALRIPVPSVEEQKKYVIFVEQSDKSKFELNRALDELTATYKQIIKDNLG